MIDLNSEEYLQKLKVAAASDDGQIIIEYLKHELKAHDYENIDLDKSYSELGMDYAVCRVINKYFKTVLSILGEQE